MDGRQVTTLVLGAAVFTGALAACAPTTPMASSATDRSPGQCFLANQIVNFAGEKDGPLYIRARVSDVFEVSHGPCPGMEVFTTALAIEPIVAVSDRLCVGDEVSLRPLSRTTIPVTCRARVERRLTAEEARALPDSVRP